MGTIFPSNELIQHAKMFRVRVCRNMQRGIFGIDLYKRNTNFLVLWTIPGLPAECVGIKSDDIIIAINNCPIHKQTNLIDMCTENEIIFTILRKPHVPHKNTTRLKWHSVRQISNHNNKLYQMELKVQTRHKFTRRIREPTVYYIARTTTPTHPEYHPFVVATPTSRDILI